MPLGFDPPHPGGMAENSPTFQRWVREFREAKVPKGRLKPCTIVTVQIVGRASRLSWGRLALGRTSAGKRPGPAGETPAPLPEQLRTIYQPSLRDLSCCGRWFPTLKLWAIIVCPSGTMMWPGFAGLVWKQILAALDFPVCRIAGFQTCVVRTLSNSTVYGHGCRRYSKFGNQRYTWATRP
jgi:hypothetical protein